jgi:hypothetical protein
MSFIDWTLRAKLRDDEGHRFWVPGSSLREAPE